MTDDLYAILPTFAAVLGLLLGLGTGIHSVTHKRDTRAAAGWLALSMLVPFVGSFLYLALGINRVQRRAARLRGRRALTAGFTRSGHHPTVVDLPPDIGMLEPLATHVGRVTGRTLSRGNEAAYFEFGDEAYEAMLQAIDDAGVSIALSTYIFDLDPAGRRFIDALDRAHRRGVAVRVLIDGAGARYSRESTVAALRQRGVETALFLPSRNRGLLRHLNLRMHRKILVVDGVVGFTGGMNIRHGHERGAPVGDRIRDLHARFRGPVVGHLMRMFAEDWWIARDEHLHGPAWFAEPVVAGTALARGIPQGPDETSQNLQSTLACAFTLARNSIRIATPYYFPDAELLAAFRAARFRGVEVTVMLPERSNLPFVDWAMNALLWQSITAGVSIQRVPAPFDHSKLVLVDDAWALIGSANIDPRSLRLNFEYCVELYGEEAVSPLSRLFAERLATSRPQPLEELDGRPWLIKVRDGFTRLLSPYL